MLYLRLRRPAVLVEANDNFSVRKSMKNPGKKTRANGRRKLRRLPLVTIIVAATALVIGAATVVSRQRTPLNNSEAKKASAELATAHSNAFSSLGQDVQVPIGQVKPLTQEEAQKLAEGLKQLINQSTDGLAAVQHPDGSVSIDLDGRFQNVTVAKKNSDGTVTQGCVDNRGAAAEFFGLDPRLLGVESRTTPAPEAKPAPKQVDQQILTRSKL